MNAPEPQFAVDRWATPTADLVGDPGVPAPWPALGARTRITFMGEDTFTTEDSRHRQSVDDGERDGRGHDLLRASRLPSLAHRTPLWRVMKRRVVCVQPELDTASLVSILVRLDLRAVAVVDDEGRPIGVVSRSDLLRHRGRDDEDEPPLRVTGPYGGHGDYLGPGFQTDIQSECVADVMMCLTFSLPESATLSRAAAIMAYEGVHQIPVVAPDGKVVGLITSLDVVRWLAQHDGYLAVEDR